MWSEILDILTSAQVVETSVTITDNSPSQDYTHPDYTITCLPTGGPSSRLEKANDEFMNASRVVWLGIKLREEPLKIWTRYKE